MKKLSCFAALLFLLAISPFESQAQTDIAESKRKLIVELSTITMDAYDVDKEFKKGMEDQKRIMLASFGDGYPADPSLSESEKKAAKEKSIATFNRIFDRISEQVGKEVDFKSFVTRYLFQAYDKYYSEDELKELITFYKTPTGKKTLMTMSPIQADIMKAYESDLLPKILKISKEISAQEIKEMLKELERKTASDESPNPDSY